MKNYRAETNGIGDLIVTASRDGFRARGIIFYFRAYADTAAVVRDKRKFITFGAVGTRRVTVSKRLVLQSVGITLRYRNTRA